MVKVEEHVIVAVEENITMMRKVGEEKKSVTWSAVSSASQVSLKLNYR